ncbi:MAG TPA: DUF3025 domain-containing protein [Burkholderiales bacterium]|nr:DUF3025 domain-containing protein [Burkholderiales bacterium]
MFEPFARCAGRLGGSTDWPRRSALDALLAEHRVRNARGDALRAVGPGVGGAAAYEGRVFERRELAVREGEWHDLMNVLVWCVFPATKAALNARHAESAAAEAGGRRGRARDALTLFDESGAIVVSSDADLLDELRAFRWRELFVGKRARVRTALRVYLFGHGLLEKALAPYVGMTAQAITLAVDREVIENRALVDRATAKYVADVLTTPRDLAPLPVLGVPGWWKANEEEAFYDDTAYFRPGRRR